MAEGERVKTPRIFSRTRRTEITDLRREVEQLTQTRDRLRAEQALFGRGTAETTTSQDSTSRDTVYVLHDDTEEARAFDEFYRAYDEVHVKTRKFLLD